MIERKLRINNLFDFYGELLTSNQKAVVNLYVLEDLTLGEISEELGVSRQAVYDSLKRSESLLEDYESKLGLVAKFKAHQDVLEEVIEALDQMKSLLPEKEGRALAAIEEKIDTLIY